MSAVSTESLNKVEQVLVAQATVNPTHLADELFAVVDVIDSNGGFRRGLTDPSREAAQRAGIARSVLGGKISEAALAVVSAAAEARWSAERDLADALEHVAVTSVALSAERRGGVDALEQTVNELLTFINTVDASAEAQAALADTRASKEALKKLAVSLGGSVSTAEGKLLLERVGTAARGTTAARLASAFVEIIVKRQNRWIARVTSATALTAEQIAKLQGSLNKTYGKELKLDITVDPSVLGGLRVQVGDEVIDGTLSTRLSELGRAFA
ncbi:F0F1 ATP synthase subunit delta [Rothia nasimurium]|uniref:F0F1 ATP synthase subunit delta n=1 Tax=Rothia nasimurium TaxID=85336 RepID=UPI001F007B70|nr:F0F1 ATP synthase subunit delta [Rothia nasimurium]